MQPQSFPRPYRGLIQRPVIDDDDLTRRRRQRRQRREGRSNARFLIVGRDQDRNRGKWIRRFGTSWSRSLGHIPFARQSHPQNETCPKQQQQNICDAQERGKHDGPPLSEFLHNPPCTALHHIAVERRHAGIVIHWVHATFVTYDIAVGRAPAASSIAISLTCALLRRRPQRKQEIVVARDFLLIRGKAECDSFGTGAYPQLLSR